MQKKLLGLFFSMVTLTAAAQLAAPDHFASTITKDDLKKQLTVIAGPEMEGRETGTAGQHKAAAYIASQFKAFGLLPAPGTDNYQQQFFIGYDTVLKSQLSFNGKTLISGKDYTDEVNTNTSGTVKAKEIIFTGYGISDEKYDDYAGKDVKGKIVVFFGGEPKTEPRQYYITGTRSYSTWTYPGGLSQKLAVAKEKGAVAAIVINPALDSITTGYANAAKKSSVHLVSGDKNSIPAVSIAGGNVKIMLADNQLDSFVAKAKRNELLNTIVYSSKRTVIYNYEGKKITQNASNVAGYIEGSDRKDEYIILTAHFDHLGSRNGNIYYGADDDGSGTCAVIEMAEAFSKAKAAGNGPRRSVVFMTVSGEEKGLWGSEYYSEHPLFPLEKTSVDLNTDMIGRIDTERKTADSLNYVYVIGHDKLSSELVGINEDANTKYTGLVLDYKYDDPNDRNRIYYRSDHYNFARKGVPILFFYDGMLQADYHKPTDTIDKIYWDIYEKRARMIFNTAWQMANRDDMIKRDIPLN